MSAKRFMSRKDRFAALERDDADRKLMDVHERLVNLKVYLQSTKFQGDDADFVHVRTDIMPRLDDIIDASL